MLSFSISYPGLIKLPYFADLTQRGDRRWKEAQRHCEDRMTLRKTFMNEVVWSLDLQWQPYRCKRPTSICVTRIINKFS